jgi:hypothetical protein
MAAWRAQLAAAHTHRMTGDWQIELHIDLPDTSSHPATIGHLALTANDAGVDAAGLGTRPFLFGTYDIDFTPLHYQPGWSSGIPAVVGVLQSDSLVLRLEPLSDLSMELRGVISGDSVTGRWRVSARADAGATGEFVLRRP